MTTHTARPEQATQFAKVAESFCAPTMEGDFCWEGPSREYREDAVEDGRRHHPGYEPTVDVMP